MSKPTSNILVYVVLVFAFGIGKTTLCQTFAERDTRTKWSAEWISHPTAALREPGVFHFRKILNLQAAPERFLIHVSADNRFVLFVNGIRVGEGPARGNFFRWRYETFDLAPFLIRGDNVIAATVWQYGIYGARRADYRPPRFPCGGGYTCGGNDKYWHKLGSGTGTWTHCHPSSARRFAPVLGCGTWRTD